MKLKIALLAAVCVGVQGCAAIASGSMNAGSTDDTVKAKATAFFQAKPGQVKVTNIDKGLLSTTFNAEYQRKKYNCRVYYGDVTCDGVGRSPANPG